MNYPLLFLFFCTFISLWTHTTDQASLTSDLSAYETSDVLS